MGQGLGNASRRMLLRLADHELRCAEAAQERQLPYRPPDRWSLRTLIHSTFHAEITARQRAGHEAWENTLRAWQAGDKAATEHVAFLVNITARLRRPPPPLDPTAFEPKRPTDHELRRFNPTRTIATLERRGLIARYRYARRDNIALTVQGFAEARRLGLRDSAVVDLERVAANWRDPDARGLEGFMLGYDDVLLRDDGPPMEADPESSFGFRRLVVGKFVVDER
jgi:hypothetical protein